MIVPSKILDEPYHALVAYHLPKEHIFHKIESFQDTLEHLKAEDFVQSPLPLDNNLDFQDLMRFVAFRFWYACHKFPELQSKVETKYKKVITAFKDNETMPEKNAFKEALNLQKCLLFHLSRALIENDSKLVNRNLADLDFAAYVGKDDDQDSMYAIDQIKKCLLKIFASASFKEAVKTFGVVTNMPLTETVLSSLLDDLKNIRAVPITITPPCVYGMVLPDGIAINFANIQDLVKPDEKNPVDVILSVGLWAAIHEIGHLLIRSEAFSNHLYFSKMTPPTEYSYSGTTYKNLEAGFLFSIIFLGTLDKMIWEKPDLIAKLVNLDVSNPHIPILSVEELTGIPEIEFKNLTNSGALMVRTRKYKPIKL